MITYNTFHGMSWKFQFMIQLTFDNVKVGASIQSLEKYKLNASKITFPCCV